MENYYDQDDQIKVGDYIYAKGNNIAVVSKITNSYIFYRFLSLKGSIDSPCAVRQAAKYFGLINVKTRGDEWDGFVTIPLKGNEHAFTEGVDEYRQKKNNQVISYASKDNATKTYDFYRG